VDGFYTQFFGGSGTHFHTGTGGGIGLNFFFHYFGVGYEAAWYDNGGITAHMPSAGNFFLRYSICIWHLAPYAMVVGGGGAWNPDGIGYGCEPSMRARARSSKTLRRVSPGAANKENRRQERERECPRRCVVHHREIEVERAERPDGAAEREEPRYDPARTAHHAKYQR
jgi:hypothetical protein